MAENGLDSPWVRTRRPRPSARINLVCLPHAGGSASYYREWGARLPEAVEVHVVQYPGREERLAEPLIDTMAEMADTVAEVLRPLFARPLVLFGHSMGALVAYHLARRRLELGLRKPDALAVAAYAAPHLANVSIAVEDVSDVDLARYLCDIDGMRRLPGTACADAGQAWHLY